jgi:hypothetical protein
MSAEFESEIQKTVDCMGELFGGWEGMGCNCVHWIKVARDRTDCCEHGNELHDYLSNC